MTADRELLELAAKAAGYATSHPMNVARLAMVPPIDALWVGFEDGKFSTEWNPLVDNGDALRLAIDLGIDLCKPPVGNAAAWDHPNRYAITRRAIVRAAAEIGKSSQCGDCGGTRKVDGLPCRICCPTDDGPEGIDDER